MGLEHLRVSTDPGVNAWAREKPPAQKLSRLNNTTNLSKVLINKLEFQSSSRHNYRCSADANLFDAGGLALNFETEAARSINEVALLDHETIDAVGSFDARSAVIDQVTAQWPGRAAGGRIFADILADEKS